MTHSSHRVLLGYHSGHFSLPAFRVAELESIAEASAGDPIALLWLFATYCEPGAFPSTLAKELLGRLPGVDRSTVLRAVEALQQRLTMPGLTWRDDPERGWITDSPNSQCNPASALSVLTDEDYAYIRGFFT